MKNLTQKNNPLVSVCMITYNHENYIREAIEGVIMQKIKFDIELVVGEDYSCDNTRIICQEYYDKYPNYINLLSSGKNIGMINNFIRTLEACTGKYIAICEGDDYWTDPFKLQKQVDFLEANPDFAICFHNARKLVQKTGDDSSLFFENSKPKKTSYLRDIIKNNYIPTLTCVFRNNLFSTFPDWFFDTFPGDWPLHILNAQYGKIKYIDEVMGVYRIHIGGAVSTGNNPIATYEKVIDTFENIGRWGKIRPGNMLSRTLSKLYYELAALYAKEKDYQNAQFAISKCFVKRQFSIKQTLKAIFLLVKIYIRIKHTFIHESISKDFQK